MKVRRLVNAGRPARVGLDQETRDRAAAHVRGQYPQALAVEVHPYGDGLVAEVTLEIDGERTTRVGPVRGLEDN